MARTEAKLAQRPVQRPAKAAAPRRMPAFVEGIVRYQREVWVELNRVDWPSRREIISMTVVVIVVLVVLSLYLGLFDYIYTFVIRRWLLKTPPS
jgi:preprotein translocase subunit SecE